VQEDVDVIGISILSGAHLPIMRRVCELQAKHLIDDVPILLGGIIPDEDVPELKAMGVAEVFTPGASLEEIIGWIKKNAR
jgi:methylmalonyl-CoA mutase C-terminal domain/subunit